MPPKLPIKDPWWQIVLRHFTTFVLIVTATWWLAVPRVQAFIIETVDGRISTIERQLTDIMIKLQHIDQQLDRIEESKKRNG